jgi:hypothetical protein
MANPKKNTKQLKGSRLYNYLIKTLGEQNRAKKRKEKLSYEEKREIVSTKLFPKYNKQKRALKGEIKKDIDKIVKGIPDIDTSLCKPDFFPYDSVINIDYYLLQEHIWNTPVTECYDVMVNAGDFGITGIFSTKKQTYTTSGVSDIVNNLNAEARASDYASGDVYFNGFLMIKPNKKADGKPKNYYIEYVLYINGEPQSGSDAEDAPPFKGTEKQAQKSREKQVKKIKTEKAKYQQKKGQRQKQAIKKKEKDPVNKAIVEDYKEEMARAKARYKAKIITKEQFDKLIKVLTNTKNQNLK